MRAMCIALSLAIAGTGAADDDDLRLLHETPVKASAAQVRELLAGGFVLQRGWGDSVAEYVFRSDGQVAFSAPSMLWRCERPVPYRLRGNNLVFDCQFRESKGMSSRVVPRHFEVEVRSMSADTVVFVEDITWIELLDSDAGARPRSRKDRP